MEEIRLLNPDELEHAETLGRFAFQYQGQPGPVQPKPGEDVLGSFIDGNLAAKLTVLHLHTYVGGRVVPMGGIAGVASWPEHRRRGHVAGLLRVSLERMRAQGQLLSFLAPFSHGFYRRYGWETYVDRKRCVIDNRNLQAFKEVEGRFERTDQMEILEPLYKAYATKYNGTLCRSSSWWERKIGRNENNSRVIVYYGTDDSPAGYLMYRVSDREMDVSEMVFRDERVRRALLHFIFQHDSMIDRVRVTVPVDDPLSFAFDNPRIGQEIETYFMARIVDVAPFLEQYAYAQSDEDDMLSVQVTDADAPWNDGTHSLTIRADGSAAVTRRGANHSSGSVRIDVRCGIQTLSAMMMGYLRPEQLMDMGKLEGSERAIRILEERLPKVQTFLMDFF